MPVTPQRKYELLKQVGIDPDKYWIDDSGNVIDLPKDNSAMAGIKTAALNLPRTAAGVGGAALGAASAGALGLPTGPGAVAAGLAGGFGGAALGSTIGEKLQNALYPDDVLMAQQARSVRNPGAVQLGDLASQAVFMRPSVSQLRDAGRGIRALTTIPSFAKMRPAQASALMDVGTGGAIEAGSTMAQGGDLSEILKNAAIGAVFSNPTGVTRAMTGGIFSPHVADQGLRDVVNPADLLVKPGEPVVEKPREVNPELLKAFMKQQKTDAKLAEQLAALKANQEAAAKKAQIEAEQGIGFEQPLPAQDFTLPPNLNSVEARFLRSQAVEPDVEVTLDPQVKPQPKPPVILEPGTPGALDQELSIRTTQPFFDWWANNANENYRTRMTQGRPTGEQDQEVAGVTEGTRGPDGKRNITVNKEAYTDTAPHELTHGMILDVLQHGKKGEQAEMRRLLKLAGVDEEAFVQGVGEDVVRRFMAGATTTKTTDAGTTTTTAPGMDDSWRSDFVSFMKYKFGKASPEDVRRIMSNTMLRGGGPKGVSKIAAKPTQEVEEKPPVMPEPPRPEVNAEEMAKTYQPTEQPVDPPVNEEFNRSMQETRDRMRVEEMNRQNAGKVENVQAPPVEPYVPTVEAQSIKPAPVEPTATFVTAKGSEYSIDANGNTTRLKKSAGKGQGKVHEAMPVVFISAKGSDAILNEMNVRTIIAEQNSDGSFTQLRPGFGEKITDNGNIHVLAVSRVDGKIQAAIKATTKPAVGLHPFEIAYRGDQRTTHLGNQIVKLDFRNSVEPVIAEPQLIIEPETPQDLAQPRSAELANLPQPNRPVGSARRGAERVAAKEFSKLKKEVRNIDPADLADVGRPEARTYSGESIPANVRRGRVVSENARESADDLEARRIEARLAGEERPRYQEFGKDRTFATDFEKELAKSAPFKIQSSKDGRLNRNDIKAAVAKLNPTEQELLKEAGLEQYLTKVARPTKEELMSWAEENLPRVEVKELTADGAKKTLESELGGLQHNWYDNLSMQQRSVVDAMIAGEDVPNAEIDANFRQEDRPTLNRYVELALRAEGTINDGMGLDNDSATAAYDIHNINPRQLADMPGAVDLLVRLPGAGKKAERWKDPAGNVMASEAEPLYSSDHYPQSGDNLLAHVRAYEHTMPNGERVLRVFELQSDWAQDRRKAEANLEVKKNPINDKFGVYDKTAKRFESELGRGSFRTEAEASAYKDEILDRNTKNHPLLPHHQRLALKAAIEHARKRGIKRVVVDDAETAMLTEGHDKIIDRARKEVAEANSGKDTVRLGIDGQGKRVPIEEELRVIERRYKNNGAKFEIQNGKIVMTRGPFEGGMGLSYDNVLQQMMRDLSGDGVKVELGEHRNAVGEKRVVGPDGQTRTPYDPIMGDEREIRDPRPDLIFKNPDGTPKTQSTGFAYDVSAAQARRDAGEPFSYAGRRYQQFGKDRTLPIREWAKDSVLKSDDGELLPLYHGTKTPGFNSFRTEGAEASGYHYGEGAYFTPDPTRASSYAGAKQKVVDYDSDGNAVYGYDNEQAGGVYKVYTNLRNPFETMSDAGVSDIGYKLSMDNPTEYKALASEVAKKNGYTSGSGVGTTEVGNYYLRKQGYDGVVKRRPNGEVVEVVVFDKNNVKSAFGGDARNINPTSGDVRYQQFGPNRPTSGLADPVGRRDFSPFESASQKAARSDNPVIRTVGRALTELFPAQRAMRGKYRALPEAFANLNEKDKDLLYKILIDEYRAGQPAPGTVPARLRKEYNDVRRTLRQMRDDQIKAGQRNSNGVVPGIDDSYFPNVVDPSVRKTLADEIDSPRFKQLKDEFVKFNEANLRSKNYSAAKANEEANKLFNRFIGTLNKQPVEGAFDFGAVTLPEGSRLPDNWLHSDPAEAMSQYVRDWSRSRTFHDIVQTNEDVMAGLGQEEFFVNGKKTPVKNRVATPAVKDNNILFLLNEAIGIRRGSQDKITGAIGRAASAAWLANPITRSVDIATSLFKGLGMVTPAQIPGLVSNLRNLGKSYERAHDTGWIREDGNTIVGEVLGAGEAFSNGVDKFSKGLSKYTGSEKLENFGRGLSQNIGEYIARTNTALAQSGNKRATDFLDRVAPNWRTLSEAELGTRIGQLFQGRYDATNLPQWLSDSPAAPFFSLARWNIEQWNNFREFAIKPARNGDPVPLISMLVAGIVGGVGIKEIREALSGRKSKIATLKEIAEAPEGSAKYKEAVRYLGNLAQLSGTIGIVGEMANWGLDIASKDMPAAASMPALEVTRDIIPRLIAAGNAMMDGHDPLTVITQMSRDIGNEHVSAYRFLEGMAARTGVSDFAKAELDAANDRRDFRTGKRLRGEPIKAAVQLPINYDNPEERAMEEERDPVKRRQLALALKAKIKQDPDKDSRERKMRAAATSRPSYLPSKENDPKAFREQLDFVRRTQGEDKVIELKKRYLRDKKNSDSQRKMFNQ